MSIWNHLFNIYERRNWALRKMPASPLRDYFEVPFPDKDTDWRQVDYLALDFETTGLDEHKDEILSFGYTTINGSCMRMADATHILTRPRGGIPGESAVIHGIMDDAAASAEALEDVLPILLNALAGKAMLAHYAAIEYHFLSNACKRIYGYPFIGPVVDTLASEVLILRNREIPIQSGDLRLANVRKRYGLPRYRAHNALMDAISAGELFLAQMATKVEGKNIRLKDLTVVS
ncbi:MAG: exonuclease domain-containing protein [Gammaproteobacteria bacterium]|jgi:DNA polymerase III subunit epsilon